MMVCKWEKRMERFMHGQESKMSFVIYDYFIDLFKINFILLDCHRKVKRKSKVIKQKLLKIIQFNALAFSLFHFMFLFISQSSFSSQATERENKPWSPRLQACCQLRRDASCCQFKGVFYRRENPLGNGKNYNIFWKVGHFLLLICIISCFSFFLQYYSIFFINKRKFMLIPY